MTSTGLLELTDIQDKFVINKKFVLVDSSKYTDEAFQYILEAIDANGAIGFVSDLKKIYAKGQYYNDLDDLRYFSTIAAVNADGTVVSAMTAPNAASTLKFRGDGITNVTTNSATGEIIVSTSISDIIDITGGIENKLDDIIASYASKDYIAENYQEKLIAGSYISIDSDNVITTYNLPTFTYLFTEYASYAYVAETNSRLKGLTSVLVTDYADRLETQQIAKTAADNAVSAVIDGADDAFDTLKEIADWIVNSGEYVEATPSATDDKSAKYYEQVEGKYVDATYPLDLENKQYYIYAATTAADLLSNISALDTEVGNPNAYVYTDINGVKQIYTGNVTTLTAVGENQYSYESTDGNIYVVEREFATGIYKVIDDTSAYLENKITSITGDIGNLSTILYYLTTTSNSSYAYLSFEPDEYDGIQKSRNIKMNLVEGVFENNSEAEGYGTITTDGVATTNTVDAMINYRNSWIILNGAI